MGLIPLLIQTKTLRNTKPDKKIQEKADSKKKDFGVIMKQTLSSGFIFKTFK